jgi:hypothetical protein
MDRVRHSVAFVAMWIGVVACGIVVSPEPEVVGEASLSPTVTNTVTHTLAPTATHTPKPAPNVSASLSPSTSSPRAEPADGTETSTPVPTSTHTPTFTSTPGPTPSSLPPTVSTQPPSETETLTPSPVVPTPAPSMESGGETSYRYSPVGPAQPDLSQPCPGCPRAPGYIVGRVVDAGGVPLAGVRLVCYNDWHRYPVVGTKGSGEYDFPILQAEATWYVVVLDEADQPLSLEAPVHFNPLEACWYRLDWQRID